jgi:hypothetical protein
MGIIDFIKRITIQTAVYWASPVADGFGKNVFDDPVEINVRWVDKKELKTEGRAGQPAVEEISNAEVLINEELDMGGYLMLGELTDLPSDDSNPIEIEGAYKIDKVTKIPLLRSTTEFVYKAYV